MAKEKNLTIETVIVLPRNKKYCSYVLNDGSKHSKKYEDMVVFLIELNPSLTKEIRDLLSRFRYFIQYVNANEIEEFSFDFDYERKLHKEREFHQQLKNPEKALERIRSKTSKNFFQASEDFFKKVSRGKR